MITLRDYQEQISNSAVEKLRSYNLCYLAMEVRTGKTLTAIATAHKYGARSILFVTKKKAIPDISDQLEQYGEVEYFVINFEQLHNLTDGSKFDFIVIDEAHSLGAFPTPSNRAKELKRICDGKPILYLSGTPTPETYTQIFHQFWISSYSPFKEYKNFYKWADDFVYRKMKYVFNRQIRDYSHAKEDQIKSAMDHLFLSFTQEEAGFEQFVDETILTVKMEDSTYKLADRLRIHKIAKNASGDVVMADTAVKLMNKLHQVYSGTVIVDEPSRFGKPFDFTKGEFIKHHFAGKRLAIFYKFAAELAVLVYVFSGEWTNDPAQFQSGEKRVFLSQIVSGREGINLSEADCLVFMNIDFSATSYWQSRARIQTKDRTKDAKIYWIFALNGIEEKIHKAVMEKKDYTLSHFQKDFLKKV